MGATQCASTQNRVSHRSGSTGSAQAALSPCNIYRVIAWACDVCCRQYQAGLPGSSTPSRINNSHYLQPMCACSADSATASCAVHKVSQCNTVLHSQSRLSRIMYSQPVSTIVLQQHSIVLQQQQASVTHQRWTAATRIVGLKLLHGDVYDDYDWAHNGPQPSTCVQYLGSALCPASPVMWFSVQYGSQ